MKDKIPFYNIINMFFVGAAFVFLTALLFINRLVEIDFGAPIFAFCKDWSVVVTAVLVIAIYEVGFILNRLGSAILGTLFEKTIWKREEYGIDISEISEKNPTFKAMKTELVLIRTHVLMYIMLGVFSLFADYKWAAFICVALIVLLILSGCRHNKRINKIRKDYAENKAKEAEEFRLQEERRKEKADEYRQQISEYVN